MKGKQKADVRKAIVQARRERRAIAEKMVHDLTGEQHRPGVSYLVYLHQESSVRPELWDACEDPVELQESLEHLDLEDVEVVRVEMPGEVSDERA